MTEQDKALIAQFDTLLLGGADPERVATFLEKKGHHEAAKHVRTNYPRIAGAKYSH